MSRVLALDFGEKRIGLAISDELKILAIPFGIILYKNKNQVSDELKKICQENEISEIVIGLPKTMKGEIAFQSLKTQKFADFLKKTINLPLFFEDERLTSQEALRLKKEKKSGLSLDELSAKIILENYLEKRKND